MSARVPGVGLAAVVGQVAVVVIRERSPVPTGDLVGIVIGRRGQRRRQSRTRQAATHLRAPAGGIVVVDESAQRCPIQLIGEGVEARALIVDVGDDHAVGQSHRSAAVVVVIAEANTGRALQYVKQAVGLGVILVADLGLAGHLQAGRPPQSICHDHDRARANGFRRGAIQVVVAVGDVA